MMKGRESALEYTFPRNDEPRPKGSFFGPYSTIPFGRQRYSDWEIWLKRNFPFGKNDIRNGASFCVRFTHDKLYVFIILIN